MFTFLSTCPKWAWSGLNQKHFFLSNSFFLIHLNWRHVWVDYGKMVYCQLKSIVFIIIVWYIEFWQSLRWKSCRDICSWWRKVWYNGSEPILEEAFFRFDYSVDARNARFSSLFFANTEKKDTHAISNPKVPLYFPNYEHDAGQQIFHFESHLYHFKEHVYC